MAVHLVKFVGLHFQRSLRPQVSAQRRLAPPMDTLQTVLSFWNAMSDMSMQSRLRWQNLKFLWNLLEKGDLWELKVASWEGLLLALT